MKTTHSSHTVCRVSAAVALTIAVFSGVLLGGLSVQAQTTNYYWNITSAGEYTNDADWAGGVAPMGLANIAPSGSTNYTAWVTNSGTILYGDGGNGSSTGYTWTNMLGELEVGSNGTVNMNSGSLTLTNEAGTALNLGFGGAGTFIMSGGSLTVARNNGGSDYQDGFLFATSAAPLSSGTFSLSGGIATALCGVEIGSGGLGTLDVSGGVLIDNGWFGLGHGGTSTKPFTGSGAFNQSGGTVYILRNSGTEGATDGIEMNQNGTNAVLNISGGTLYTVRIGLGPNTAGQTNCPSAINISGGNIYIGASGIVSNTVTTNDPESANISGGTFHTADMLIISTAANVGSTNTVLSDGTNWTWAANPSVNLTNSSLLVNGSAGPGYVTFAPEVGRTITLNNTWSGVGGFQVNGLGTVVAGTGLQGVGGGITVTNGTLVMSGTIANSSSIVVGTNGTLQPGPNTTTVGVLTANNVTFQGAGSTMNMMINATTNSVLNANNLTIDPNNSVLVVNPLAIPTAGTTYVIAQYGTLTGTFALITNSLDISFSVSYANNEITLTVLSVGSYYNWIAPSPADWSTAGDWDLGLVPNSFNDVVLFTNGVECDYATPDTNWVGQISIGPWDSSSGSLVINSGSLLVSNLFNFYDVTIGGRAGGGSGGNGETPLSPNEGGSATASLTMNGGTLTASRFGSGFYHQDAFWVGLGSNTTGTVTINGGTLNTLCGVEIGGYGYGIFNINGGAVVDNGWFGVGRGNGVASGTGAFNITAGTLYQLENGGGGTVGGSGGICLDQGCTNSMVNISGGSVYSGDIAFSGSNLNPTPVDALNICGGTIYIGYAGIYSNSSTTVSSCNISGGTFHTVDMLQSGGKGGANGAITNILADGTNWIWSFPAVNLTNSSFTVNSQTGPGNVTFAPEANRTITLNNPFFGVGGLVLNGPGTVALGAVNTYTGGTTISQGNLQINDGGSVIDPSLAFPLGSSLIFDNSGVLSLTNIITGAGNVLVNGSGTVNVGSNLQNAGAIVQTNGTLVVNGTILNASGITNSAPASDALAAQGTIIAPIGIGPTSSFEAGNTVFPGTLNASNVTVNGTFIAKINTATTMGGGINDLLICSNLTLGTGSILLIAPITPPSVGSYVIAEYSGSLTGTFGTVSNATRDVMSVSYSGGQITLNVTSVGTANLSWAGKIGSANINWDTSTTNWTNSATLALDKFQQQDTVTFNAVAPTTITNRVSVTGQVIPQSVTISGGLGYLLSGTGKISGSTGITYNDTNVSGIYTSGNNFTGPVNIEAGVLQLGSGGSSWLGTTNGPTIVNGGTLDLNGQSVGAEPLEIQGAGSTTTGTNTGAINNSSSTSPSLSGGPLNITLEGNTTLNANGNRWDIGVDSLGAGGGSFTGNGFNLTKIGNQQIWMHEVGNIGVGNIDIQQGLLGFQYTIAMGVASDTVTVESNATLGFYQLSSNSILNKEMVLNGSATLQSGGGTGSSNNFIGPVTLNGTNSIQTSLYPLYLGGTISGTGGFVLTGTGPLYLGGTNTYTGSTIIGANAHLTLATGGSISNTPLIYLTAGSNTVLDAGANNLTLNSGQTLEGSGSVNSPNFIAPSGSTLSLGTNVTYGTILFSNNLTLSGGTNILKISDNNNIGVDNDLIVVNGTLDLTGVSTLSLIPFGALNSAGPYTLIQAYGGVSGSAGNLRVLSPNPRFTLTPVIGSTYLGGQAVQINAVGSPANLLWQGFLTANWDIGTSNWLNLGSGLHDTFYDGDIPIFDDSATVNNVTVTNNVIASGIFMSNVVKTYTFSGGGTVAGALNVEGNGSGTGGTTILGMSNAPAYSAIDSSAGTLIFNLNGMTNYIVAAKITDNLGGGHGTVVFGGTNTAVLQGNNANVPFGGSPGFDGTLEVTNGILQYTNVFCLGIDSSSSGFPTYPPSYSPLIITNSGTLDFNGVAAGPSDGASPGGEKWIHISGTGFNGRGALIDSLSAAEPNGAWTLLYLDGSATIGSVTNIRCDQHVISGNYQQVEGNTNNLTYTGAGSFFFYPQSDGDTHFGNIDVASTIPGRLAFQGGPLALGPNTNYLMVEPNAEVTFYAVSNQFDTVHYGIDKIMWLKGGGASVDSAGSSNNYIGAIFLTGTNLIGTRADFHAWNSIMDTNGPGGFVLGNDSVGVSGGDLWLDGANTYSGATIISNRTLHVGSGSSLGLSRFVEVNTNCTLDLSAMPVFNFGTVATNQMLVGGGAIESPAGGININAGGTLAPGLPGPNNGLNTNTLTLTIDNSLVFNAGSIYYVGVNKTTPAPATQPSDHVTGLTSVTMGGTLVVTNYGTNFVAGDAIPLFSATTYVTNGFTTNNIVPTAPGPNLVWNTSTLGADGTLRVASVITVNTNSTNIVFSITSGQLSMSWPADHIGWELQVQTNLLSVGISTNWVPVAGSTNEDSVVIPINLTNGSVFYRLVYPPQ